MHFGVGANVIAGTTVALPTQGIANVSVDWGGGSTGTATSGGNLLHTYTGYGH